MHNAGTTPVYFTHDGILKKKIVLYIVSDLRNDIAINIIEILQNAVRFIKYLHHT